MNERAINAAIRGEATGEDESGLLPTTRALLELWREHHRGLGRRSLTRSMALAERIAEEDPERIPHARLLVGLLALESGDLEVAEVALAELTHPLARVAMSRLARWVGAWSTAREVLRTELQRKPDAWARAWLLLALAELECALDRLGLARALLESVRRRPVRDVALRHATLDLEARIRLAFGEATPGLEAELAAGLDEARGARAFGRAARLLTWWAVCRAQRGAQAEAGAMLEEAVATLITLERMPDLAASATQRARWMGGASLPPELRAWFERRGVAALRFDYYRAIGAREEERDSSAAQRSFQHARDETGAFLEALSPDDRLALHALPWWGWLESLDEAGDRLEGLE